MIFWNLLFFLRRNSKHKEVLLTRTLHDVDFSLPFSICCELKNYEVGAFFRGLSRKAESKTCRV